MVVFTWSSKYFGGINGQQLGYGYPGMGQSAAANGRQGHSGYQLPRLGNALLVANL